MWIAYNLYLWNIECSPSRKRQTRGWVVNCLQFVSLKYWMQQIQYCMLRLCRCELLTICIFEILNAAYINLKFKVVSLWIAYNLYLWNIECSLICFMFITSQCCELLTICIFEILNAALGIYQCNAYQLWIAYNLYLWNIECSLIPHCFCRLLVVNCLQFVSLKYWMQHVNPLPNFILSCELLTICIFEILNAAH